MPTLVRDVDVLAGRIQSTHATCGRDRSLVLIGGCSRVGKSYLCERLCSRLRDVGLGVTYVSLDQWLLGIDERPNPSNVLQRYDVAAIERDVSLLLSGTPVTPPAYDAKTRLRRREASDMTLTAGKGIVVADAVIALGITGLVKVALMRVFVTVSDAVRRHRLEDFYCNYKDMVPQAALRLIAERESEEVPFVKQTQDHADIIFEW